MSEFVASDASLSYHQKPETSNFAFTTMTNPLGNRRPVVLAALAHPDDAELLCGGTLARLAERGWTVCVVTATAGDCGSMLQDSATIAARRLGEAQAAAAVLGGTHECLGEQDGRVFLGERPISALVAILRRVQPTIVLTHALSDYMIDHEQMALIARSATFIASAPNFPSGKPQPIAAVPYLYHTDPVGLHDNHGAEVAVTTVIDISSVLEKKRRALLCHDSQMGWLREAHGVADPTAEMVSWAARRGAHIGSPAAEGFCQHRGHAYPTDDLLATTLI